MKHRDTNVYRARFRNLKLIAFGIDQTLQYEADIDIYQARVEPQLWRARPTFQHSKHVWEAASPAGLQSIIEDDFEYQLSPWSLVQAAPLKPKPTLRRIGPQREERQAS